MRTTANQQLINAFRKIINRIFCAGDYLFPEDLSSSYRIVAESLGFQQTEFDKEELNAIVLLSWSENYTITEDRLKHDLSLSSDALHSISCSLKTKGIAISITEDMEPALRLTDNAIAGMDLRKVKAPDEMNIDGELMEKQRAFARKARAAVAGDKITEFEKHIEKGSCESDVLDMNDAVSFVDSVFQLLKDGRCYVCDAVEVIEYGLPERFPGSDLTIALDRLGLGSLKTEERFVMYYALLGFVKDFINPVNIPLNGTFFLQMGRREESNARKALKTLVMEGYLEALNEDSDPDNYNHDSAGMVYRLSPKLARKGFHGLTDAVNYTSVMRYARLVKSRDVREKRLFYPDDVASQVKRIRDLAMPENGQRVKDALRQHGDRTGLACVLQGAPGTGKTELALQICRESGRDLLIADAARLYSKWAGQSSRNIKELFDICEYISAICDAGPILLLNEADGILGRRLTGSGGDSASAQDSNESMSVLLQCMENYDGLLIATTNLACNFDPAFLSRFLIDVSIPLPDETTRQKIWRSVLPEVSDEILMEAAVFEFAGRNIENIKRKFIIEMALSRNGAPESLLIELCNEELEKTQQPEATPFKARKRIGFGA